MKKIAIFALLVMAMAAELFLPEIREDLREKEAVYAGEAQIAMVDAHLSQALRASSAPLLSRSDISPAGGITPLGGGEPCEDGLTEEERAWYETGSEIPWEEERNEAALLLSGYYRDDVPLSYELQAALHAICEQYGVDYALALGLIEVESSFDTEAVSSCGCYGLMQLNPLYFPAGMTPFENIYAGVAYLAEQLERYGDTAAALTAYHAGHDNGERGYAKAVLAAAERWRAE